MNWLKAGASMVLGDYAIYRIYTWPAKQPPNSVLPVRRVDVAELGEYQEHAWYGGSNCCAYACFEGSRIVGLCFYWYGDRYRTRNFWPLKEGEAKLVQIFVPPEFRGKGIATALLASSAAKMGEEGFHRLYARIWHSNGPSLWAFERAGWACLGTVFELNPLRRKKPIRIVTKRADKRLTSE